MITNGEDSGWCGRLLHRHHLDVSSDPSPRITRIALTTCKNSVPDYPREDEKLRSLALSRRRGGNCANTFEVLQQLLDKSYKLELSLCAVLPAENSEAVAFVRHSLDSKIRLDYCIYRSNFTETASSYIIKSLATGSRTIVNFNELPEMTVDEFVSKARAIGSRAEMYHFEGRLPDVTLECIKYLRKHLPETKISVEVEKPGRLGLEELAAAADIVFFAKGWAVSKGYRSAEDCVRNQALGFEDRRLLCCTWGEDGAVALQANILEISSAVITQNAVVRDTVGAGDTFIAGMLYASICRTEWALREKVVFANKLAGQKVLQEGFQGLYPEALELR